MQNVIEGKKYLILINYARQGCIYFCKPFLCLIISVGMSSGGENILL